MPGKDPMQINKRRRQLCLVAGIVALAVAMPSPRSRTGGDVAAAPPITAPVVASAEASTPAKGDAAVLLHILGPESLPEIQICQAISPPCGGACDPVIHGVDCLSGNGCAEPTWRDLGPLPWQTYAHGEYIGPHRLPHMPEYRLRVDDQLDFVYRLTREQTSLPYELNVGDVIRVESLTDANIDRNELVIQPDGSITLRLLGQAPAARRTIAELTAELEERYKNTTACRRSR
jgi:polysaccharide biosynthesis/export protein